MKFSRETTITLVLAVFGLAIAIYLTWTHYQDGALVCSVGDCETVQSSEYAEVLDTPIALFGVAMFSAVSGLVLVRTIRPATDETVSIGILFLALCSTLYYVYLTWIELFVLEAVCQWCVLSSVMVVGILINEGRRFLRESASVSH